MEHVRRPSDNEVINSRLRDPDDELELVIVKDMMLTGFDAPPLHTLYLDRPLKGALLMQTLARVNRTFRGKADRLLVAYAPLVDNLAKALAEYTVRDQAEKPVGRDTGEAADLTKELVARIRILLGGYDWKTVLNAGGAEGLHQRGDRCHQLPARGRARERTRARRRNARCAIPQVLEPARAGVGAGIRGQEPSRAASRDRVLRGGAGVDGEVRRPRPSGPRRADPG